MPSSTCKEKKAQTINIFAIESIALINLKMKYSEWNFGDWKYLPNSR